MDESTKKTRGRITNALAVVGFVTLLAVGLWSSVQLVKYTPQIFSSLASVATSLSSIFVPAEPTEPVSEDEPAVSTNDDGSLTFNTPPAQTAGEREDGTYPVTSINVSNPNGQIDLAVQILGTGIITTDTGTFIAVSPINTSQKGAVRFEVINLGGKESGSWTFNAVLPTYPRHIFHSTSQKSLLPGDRIEFTLGFDQVNGNVSEDIVTINVDPSGSIQESSKTNNIIQKTILIAK